MGGDGMGSATCQATIRRMAAPGSGNLWVRLWDTVDCIQVLSALLPYLRAEDLFSVLTRVYVGLQIPTGLWADKGVSRQGHWLSMGDV